jgi:DNA-binding transcriptional ArsR family regulator
MKRRRIASVDQDTGEVLDGVVVYCGVKQNPYSTGWVMNSQEALELLATDKDLTGENYRVLLLLLSRLDFENWIQITQNEIVEKLDMKKQNVSRAILLLEEKGIILRGPKIGRSYAFRLNPYYGWKGKVKNLNDYRKKEEEQERREFRERYLKTVDTPTTLNKEEQPSNSPTP